MKNKKQKIEEPKTVLGSPELQDTSKFRWLGWLVFLVGSALYLNTLLHEFTQDDAIVIYDNMFTTKGVSGWKGLFTKDTFFGFFKEEGKANLVTGGRYRPFTPAMFALEYQLFGKNPLPGHLVNILLYGFLCTMIYHVVLLLAYGKKQGSNVYYLAAGTALIYGAHPLHTEAVANIKGRDEIMSMLGSILALYWIVKAYDTGKNSFVLLACVSFFIALLSKENSITFLAVVPLALYVFRSLPLGPSIMRGLALLAPAVLFMIIRTSVLGMQFGGEPTELMNNPFLKIVNNSYVPFSSAEKLATIMYTLGKYVQLLVFPHPLTHDYYPRHIGIMQLSDIKVMLSILVYIAIAYLAISGLRKRSIAGFSAAYFLITLSIVSNFIFPIGTNMSERFMFMPSLGFALGVAYLLEKYLAGISKYAFFSVMAVIVLAFGVKTITRNNVWKSDFRLFTTDVHTSQNSAKMLNAAGGALTTEGAKEKDPAKQKQMMTEALGYLEKAVTIHPNYKNAYLLMGNANYYLKDYGKAIQSYENALRIDPEFRDARTNMAVCLRDAGRQAGEVQNDLKKSEDYLKRSLQLVPNDAETMRLLGVVNGIKGNHAEAIRYFEMVVQADPKNAVNYLNLSNACEQSGNKAKAQEYMNTALSLDPDVLKKQGNR